MLHKCTQRKRQKSSKSNHKPDNHPDNPTNNEAAQKIHKVVFDDPGLRPVSPFLLDVARCPKPVFLRWLLGLVVAIVVGWRCGCEVDLWWWLHVFRVCHLQVFWILWPGVV
ncbi:hypothetical protein BDW59DRAFT_141010 [Aspergillus cavernicola]|uniref:Uncharacterized protein n=1 Tax=Aspergillus cavernicola TaxID=176166 RepID=A0ABR4IUG7_9EURO